MSDNTTSDNTTSDTTTSDTTTSDTTTSDEGNTTERDDQGAGREVARELKRLAVSCSADLLVVGRSTHPHLHLGGIPRRLLARGSLPVLVVP